MSHTHTRTYTDTQDTLHATQLALLYLLKDGKFRVGFIHNVHQEGVVPGSWVIQHSLNIEMTALLSIPLSSLTPCELMEVVDRSVLGQFCLMEFCHYYGFVFPWLFVSWVIFYLMPEIMNFTFWSSEYPLYPYKSSWGGVCVSDLATVRSPLVCL